MTTDNWHKRFGKMWIVIALTIFGIWLESEFRVSVQDSIYKRIDDQDNAMYRMNIYLNKNKQEMIQDIEKNRNDIMPACFKQPRPLKGKK